MKYFCLRIIFFITVFFSPIIFAATYQVGPTRTHTTLSALFTAIDLGAGDLVEVDGNFIYEVGTPGIIMPTPMRALQVIRLFCVASISMDSGPFCAAAQIPLSFVRPITW